MRWSWFSLLTPLVVLVMIAVAFQLTVDSGDEEDGGGLPALPAAAGTIAPAVAREAEALCRARFRMPGPPAGTSDPVALTSYASQAFAALEALLPELDRVLTARVSTTAVSVMQGYRDLLAGFAAAESSGSLSAATADAATLGARVRRLGMPACAPG